MGETAPHFGSGAEPTFSVIEAPVATVGYAAEGLV
jgi:hypothetical protein